MLNFQHNKFRAVSCLFVLMILVNAIAAQSTDALTNSTALLRITDKILQITCVFIVILKTVTISAATLMIILQGIRYIRASEKKQKERIKKDVVRTLIGVLIVILAASIVNLLLIGETTLVSFNLDVC